MSIPQSHPVYSFSTIRRPPSSTLSPYTTLFRSHSLRYTAERTGRAQRGIPWSAQTSISSKGSVDVREYRGIDRSEEHTSELQSRGHLVCRLLLEKKKRIQLDRR